MSEYFEPFWVSPTTGIASAEEIPAAATLILLNGIAIAGGMILAKAMFSSSKPGRQDIDCDYSPRLLRRSWILSLGMFSLGLLSQILILYLLLQEIPISALAKTRALFSAETALTLPIYYYARTLSSAMGVGAWGMLLFSGGTRHRRFLSIGAIIATTLFAGLHGGRLQTVIFFLGTAIIYHHGICRIRLRHMAIGSIAFLAFLTAIQFSRFESADMEDAFTAIAKTVLMPPAVNDAAFALRTFPQRIPFIGAGVTIAGLGHLFPTIGKYMSEATNTWSVIVEYLYRGRNSFAGIGGEHYSPAAEHYMQFGIPGILFLGAAFGFIYGLLFAWKSRFPKNSFLLIFSTYALISFVASVINGKMAAWLGGMGFSILLPVGVMASLAAGRRGAQWSVVGSLGLCAIAYILKRMLSEGVTEILDYAFAAALLLAYLLSLKAIAAANPVQRIPPKSA
jgi:hypothetical protein